MMLDHDSVMDELMEISGRLEFLRPTGRLHRLFLLSRLSRESTVSQRRLAQQVGVSVSVANTYLAGFADCGWTVTNPRNRRDFNYSLTEDGDAHLNHELLSYVREVFVLSHAVRSEIGSFLNGLLVERGVRRLSIYPAGTVAALVLQALDHTDVEVVALVDDDPNRRAQSVSGYVVTLPEHLRDVDFDAILVATYRHREKVLARLEQMGLHHAEVICL